MLQPITESIVREIKSQPQRSRLMDIIERFLLTESQARFLQANAMTLADFLDGRIAADDIDVADAIFAEWNKLCGEKIFRLR